MGLLHSIISICPCSTPRRATITPETISHPYPLAPRHRHGGGQDHVDTRTQSRFRPESGVYQQLNSPSHSKTISDTTTSTATPATTTDQPSRVGSGLGLGIDISPPERAYILAERTWSGGGSAGCGTGSGRGRKLKKARLVEGDWELVRTDHDWRGMRIEEPKRLSQVHGGGDGMF